MGGKRWTILSTILSTRFLSHGRRYVLSPPDAFSLPLPLADLELNRATHSEREVPAGQVTPFKNDLGNMGVVTARRKAFMAKLGQIDELDDDRPRRRSTSADQGSETTAVKATVLAASTEDSDTDTDAVAARKAAEAAAAKKEEEEAKRQDTEAAAKKKAEEEAAAKKKAEEDAAAKKAEGEAKRKEAVASVIRGLLDEIIEEVEKRGSPEAEAASLEMATGSAIMMVGDNPQMSSSWLAPGVEWEFPSGDANSRERLMGGDQDNLVSELNILDVHREQMLAERAICHWQHRLQLRSWASWVGSSTSRLCSGEQSESDSLGDEVNISNADRAQMLVDRAAEYESQGRPCSPPGTSAEAAFIGLQVTETLPHRVVAVEDLVDVNGVRQGAPDYSNPVIRKHDRILEVDGFSVESVSVEELRAMLAGELNTAVNITLAREEVQGGHPVTVLCSVKVLRHQAHRGNELMDRREEMRSQSELAARYTGSPGETPDPQTTESLQRREIERLKLELRSSGGYRAAQESEIQQLQQEVIESRAREADARKSEAACAARFQSVLKTLHDVEQTLARATQATTSQDAILRILRRIHCEKI